MAIRDIDNLRKHLQWAISLEHATFPPYLCALYTIKEGHNKEASEIVCSILMEEMLHMTLASNILNAVGGGPQYDVPDFIATYPSNLPHSDGAIKVPLAKFSRDSIETLMRIEKPQEESAPPEDDNYETIAQFYRAIEEGLMILHKELGTEQLFCGDPARQLGPNSFSYGGSGGVIPVTDLGSALEALEEIVDQGEGMNHESIWDGDRSMFHPEREEVGHYFRLKQILKGRYFQPGDTPQSGPTGEMFDVDWDAVYDMQPNPRSKNYPAGSDAELATLRFNKAYSEMLETMQRTFNGEPELITASIGEMMELKNLVLDLMKLPSGEGKTYAGPSFEYMKPELRKPITGLEPKITISKNGPYRIQRAIPLLRKEVVYTEQEEALTWRKKKSIETTPNYALCRCGESANKPFCDGTHSRIDFDGTEQADTKPTSERQHIIKGAHFDGTAIRVKSDPSLCAHAAFCVNRHGNLNKVLQSAEDVGVRSQAIAMVERCPSGALTYEVNDWDEDSEESSNDNFHSVEPDLPMAIGVIGNGPLWVTGGIHIEGVDGQLLEVRNRVTLCRCGHSKNKPFCDGAHFKINFSD